MLVIAGLTGLNGEQVHAHPMEGTNAGFVQSVDGPAPGPFLYLGAKHMVTGYDHLLFLLGVIFFLYRVKDVVLYVSLFTLGYSLTLLIGVLSGVSVNPYIIDAIIGLSVVYKVFENIHGFERLSGQLLHGEILPPERKRLTGGSRRSKRRDFCCWEVSLLQRL